MGDNSTGVNIIVESPLIPRQLKNRSLEFGIYAFASGFPSWGVCPDMGSGCGSHVQLGMGVKVADQQVSNSAILS